MGMQTELKQIEATSGKAVSNFGGQKVQDLRELIKRNANRFVDHHPHAVTRLRTG
jgi:hypothetical protein